ncbi:MAG: porin [Gemmatimonadota bacterium]|nr:porin [Gemmatimonadota bacterium]
MNKKVAVFALAIFATQTVSAEVKFSGFVDMSLFSDDGNASMSLNQFELDASTDLGEGISARADVNALGPTAPVELEQAFITYDTGEGLALTVGKFLSCTGFEAAEPTGMYQYSYSATLVYGGYQNGVSASYGSDMFGLYGAVVSSVWDGAETDVSGDESDVGFEAQVALMPVEGMTAKAALAREDEQTLINVWGMLETGSLTVAAEVNSMSDWGAYESGLGYLGMVNYGLSDQVGVTARYSAIAWTPIGSGEDDETSEITIAPSFAVSDNWGLVAEVKMLTVGDADAVTQIALESLLTF